MRLGVVGVGLQLRFGNGPGSFVMAQFQERLHLRGRLSPDGQRAQAHEEHDD